MQPSFVIPPTLLWQKQLPESGLDGRLIRDLLQSKSIERVFHDFPNSWYETIELFLDKGFILDDSRFGELIPIDGIIGAKNLVVQKGFYSQAKQANSLAFGSCGGFFDFPGSFRIFVK
jgi:hypothetical protein